MAHSDPRIPQRPQLPPQIAANMPAGGAPIIMSKQQKLDFTEQLFSRWVQLTGMQGWDVTVQRDDTGMTIRIDVPE